ncbi:hypothetical protein JRO89_XS14G0010300 [Xanthoceras sorbifolium]|uniref:Pre-rRNA-processing protein RIX1 N-terminal domain-containing protein n=1 Tax=Xanthoceras sorbifolium TaxID=99658 RepID=A0ABQ8H392_9ROSI|nr:hypothetical protein JRO89_XS14G0010300 [Xanthoceras sorbifolium]
MEPCTNMHDVKLKPRMLRTLITQRLPDEDQPSRLPTKLSHVISVVRTHKLLSEYFPQSTENKAIERWKSAVDDWVDRLQKLVSSDMPDQCWTGICLLGLTCRECNVDRFLASYSVWFDKLYSRIQQPTESQFVKVASCNSISDLLIRLGRLPNMKKDGSTLAGKLIQPVLKLLNEDSSEVVWEGAVHLLCTNLTFFPASIHRYYDSAEAAIASKLLSGKFCVNMMKKLAYCLALLPNSKGDEDNWCLLMQKILLYINVRLNDVFQGLEEETKGGEAVRELVRPGKETPPPLGGHTLLEEATDKATKRSELLQMSSISMLMLCCCKMLTTLYPVKVTIPIHSLLALVERVIMIDGSVLRAALPFMTSQQQESVCLELPDLHLYSLELLKAAIEVMHSQLLPHAAYVVRLVKTYFKRCSSPKLRIELYSVTKSLLIFMGVGMGLCLAQDIVENSFVDLKPVGDGSRCTSSSLNMKSASSVPMQSNHRKRKLGSTTIAFDEQHEKTGLEVKAPEIHPSQISVKIAALEVLEVLLSVVLFFQLYTARIPSYKDANWLPSLIFIPRMSAAFLSVFNRNEECSGNLSVNSLWHHVVTTLTKGGGLRFEAWRPDVDLLLYNLAADSCKDGWAYEENSTFLSNEPIVTSADYQLAALRALLTSLLSPSRARPLYLAQGFELFRKGKLEAGTKVSGFCMHALLALEAIIHPRALPLEQPPSINCNSTDKVNRRFPENVYSSGQKHSNPSTSGIQVSEGGDPYSYDDDLYVKWVGNSSPSEAPINSPTKNMDSVKPSEMLTVAGSSGSNIPDRSRHEQADMGMRDNDVEIVMQFQEPTYSKGATDPVITNDLDGRDMEIERAVADGASDYKDHETASGANLLADNRDGFADGGVNALASSYTEKGKAAVFDVDDDSSMDSLPDIVDVDPDSDGEESS